MDVPQLCPCGSQKTYDECCQPFHRGQKVAPTPEALMRSRYCAFAVENTDYLSATWHNRTRPHNLTLEPGTTWLQLEVVGSSQDGDLGQVSFIATFREKQEWLQLREESRFIRENNRWYYIDGNAGFEILKPGRNDRCLCGSGKKFKQCCG